MSGTTWCGWIRRTGGAWNSAEVLAFAQVRGTDFGKLVDPVEDVVLQTTRGELETRQSPLRPITAGEAWRKLIAGGEPSGCLEMGSLGLRRSQTTDFRKVLIRTEESSMAKPQQKDQEGERRLLTGRCCRLSVPNAARSAPAPLFLVRL